MRFRSAPLFLLCLSLGLSAGNGTASAQSPLRFGRITLEDGLSHRRVNDILQDREGFLWFGTQNGLDRFDGLRLKSFRREPGNPASLPGDYVFDLFEDRAGNLWVGTFSSGLARFDRGSQTFRRFRHDPSDPHSLSGDAVKTIFEDGGGALWIGTHQTLNRFDPDSGEFERFALPGASEISSVLEIAPGRLWIGTNAGLFDLEPAISGVANALWDDDLATIDHLFEDREGRIWLSTGDGLWRSPDQSSPDHSEAPTAAWNRK